MNKLAQITVKANWIENVRSVAENKRGHKVTLDLGTSSGGDNKGPSALELAIMSLADCAITIFADVCKKSNVELEEMEVIAEAEKPDGSPILSGVNMKVKIVAKDRKQKIDAVWRRTEANCPVVYIFKENIPVNIEVESISK